MLGCFFMETSAERRALRSLDDLMPSALSEATNAVLPAVPISCFMDCGVLPASWPDRCSSRAPPSRPANVMLVSVASTVAAIQMRKMPSAGIASVVLLSELVPHAAPGAGWCFRRRPSQKHATSG